MIQRIATAILSRLHTAAGHPTQEKSREELNDARQLIAGLRADLEQSNALLSQLAGQSHRQAQATQRQGATIRGILLTHSAYEAASKPLMAAKRKLNAQMKREQAKQEKAMLDAEERAKAEMTGAIAGTITPTNPGGDATASDDDDAPGDTPDTALVPA